MKRFVLIMFILLITATGCVPAVAQSPVSRPEVKAPVVVSSSPIPSDALSDIAGKDEKSSSQTNSPGNKAPTTATLGASVLLDTWDQKRNGHMLTPVDPLTGQSIPGYEPVFLGEPSFHAFSPDGRWLALSTSERDDHSDAVLHLIDLQTWTDVETPITFDTWLYALQFSPDGTHLIAALPPLAYRAEDTTRIQWFDVATQNLVAEGTLPFILRRLSFTPGGDAVLAYGVYSEQPNDFNPEARAALVSLPDLALAWQTSLPGLLDGNYGEEPSHSSGESSWYYPAIVFAPDGRTLYAVHPDADKLTTVDFAAQTVATVEITPKLSWLDWLFVLTAGVAHAKVLDGTSKQAVLSPDGRKLYVIGETRDSWQDENGEWHLKQTQHGLLVVEAETGTELARLSSEAIGGNKGSAESSISLIKITSDGKRLYLSGWGEQSAWTGVVDAASLEVSARLTGRWLTPGYRLDGEPVLLSQNIHASASIQTTLAALDPSTLEELHVWAVSDSPARWLVNENLPVPNAVSNETADLPKDPPGTCPVTLPADTSFTPPPPYPPTAPYEGWFWYGTESLWLMLPADGTWSQLAIFDKVFWWREGYEGSEEPQPELAVTGRRLDAEAPAVEVEPPATNAYHRDFHWAMLAGVSVPTPGCWEITGHYKGHELSFVVWVAP